MKKRVVMIVTVILLILCAGGYLFWRHTQENPYAYDAQAKNGIINARSKDEIQRILNQQVKDGMFNVSINSNPILTNGSSEGNLWIENVPNNKCDLKVVIKLKNGETVFETKRIKPNQNIKNAKLSEHLKKGDYPAIASFTAYDKESDKVIGNADVHLMISVKH